MSYRIYKADNPKRFEATKTQAGFIDFVTTTIGKENLYAKQEPFKTRTCEVEWKGAMHETQWGFIFVPTEKKNLLLRMSARNGGYVSTGGRDDTTDIIKLPRTDGNAEGGKSDKLGKLSLGVVTTRTCPSGPQRG